MERPVLIRRKAGTEEAHRDPRWPVLASLAVPLPMGCFAVYVYRLSASPTAVAISLTVLLIGLLLCTALGLLHGRKEVSAAASAVAMVLSVSLLVILLPGPGAVYLDAALMTAVTGGTVLMYLREVEMLEQGDPRMGVGSMAVVFLLPLGLAVLQAMSLGLRFWEGFRPGPFTTLLVPMVAAWGFIEEGLFRGILLRSAIPLLGKGALPFSSFMYASFMLLWGSLPYVLFSFLLGLLMGRVYLGSHSLMYVGTLHALTDTWMIIVLIAFGTGAI